MPGTLFVCATPIGNLEDVSLRLLATLREVTAVCAEDTRITSRLLARHDIHTPLISCHQHTPPGRILSLVARMVEGESLALVTTAGTPGISDPGPQLVLQAAAHGVTVSPLPGPCALAAALSVSGLDAQRFSFLGFLPKKPGKKRSALTAAMTREETLVLYESPFRILDTLEQIAAVNAPAEIVVCRELTKKFEEVVRGPVEEVLTAFRTRPATEARGEYVVVIKANTASR